jgi:ABC-2 type transport system permease protein
MGVGSPLSVMTSDESRSKGMTVHPIREVDQLGEARRDKPFLPGVRPRWENLLPWLELTRNLAVRDIEIRYKHSLLGLYWAIINPLLTAAVFSFVFGVIFHASSNPIPYVVFLIMGFTFWNFFANGVMSATTSITGSSALLAKVYFPRVVLPTAAILARLIDFCFSLFVLAILMLIYRIPVHWTALWVIPILCFQMLFTLGIGYLVASVNVLYRDMNQLTGLALMIWMWLSPVIYSIQSVPADLQRVLLINPMGALIQAERDLIVIGHLTNHSYLWFAFIWAGFALIAGLSVFNHIEPLFAEVM